MNLEQMLEHIRSSEGMMRNITAWVELPAREAVYEDFPGFLDERIIRALEKRGVRKLYSHQASAIRAVRRDAASSW